MFSLFAVVVVAGGLVSNIFGQWIGEHEGVVIRFSPSRQFKSAERTKERLEALTSRTLTCFGAEVSNEGVEPFRFLPARCSLVTQDNSLFVSIDCEAVSADLPADRRHLVLPGIVQPRETQSFVVAFPGAVGEGE